LRNTFAPRSSHIYIAGKAEKNLPINDCRPLALHVTNLQHTTVIGCGLRVNAAGREPDLRSRADVWVGIHVNPQFTPAQSGRDRFTCRFHCPRSLSKYSLRSTLTRIRIRGCRNEESDFPPRHVQVPHARISFFEPRRFRIIQTGSWAGSRQRCRAAREASDLLCSTQ
jgi:hypothetical protein